MIVIVGAGKFGHAISKLLGKKEHQLVDVEPDGTYSGETVDKIKQADKIIICVPSPALPDCINMISLIINPDAPILSCTKGIYEGLKTPTELIKEQLKNPTATLMGPNLAPEIMLDRPAMATIAGEHAREWTQLFTSANFRPVYEADAIGVEFGGAIKNIVALGAGLLDGYYGDNACNSMGSYIAFALRDIDHLYEHKGAADIPKLSFIGDLFATCMSENSRNHQFGHQFGEAIRKNKPLPKPEQTVEGFRTLQIVQKYAEKNKMNLPAITSLYNVFFKKAKVEDIIASWA
jgi:glycerol-3-phosphate dehydrogenase (NAD(P)+)